MSQYDFGNLESPLNGTTFFNTHLEPWRDAVHSNHAGDSRPSYASASMTWVNTTANPHILNYFDGTDDIPLWSINTSTNIATAIGNVKAPDATAGLILSNSAGTTVATFGASTSTAVSFVGAVSFPGSAAFSGKMSAPDAGELTIASGAITITGANHTVDTESDAASDDLATINGGADGVIVTIRPAHTDRTVVLVNSGNIVTPDGASIALTSTSMAVVLQYDLELTKWLVVAKPLTSGAATDGQVLMADGAGGAAWENAVGSGWVPIKTVTASNNTSIDFVNGSGGVVLDSTYKCYAVVYTGVAPASDGTDLHVRVSDDAGVSFETTNYVGRNLAADATTWSFSSGNTHEFRIVDACGNAADESSSGVLFFANPANTTKDKKVWGYGISSDNYGLPELQLFGGHYDATAAYNGIRFFFASGNITVGTFTLYGLKDA